MLFQARSSRRGKVDNITELLSNTPTSSERVASRIILNTETPFLTTLGSKVKVVSSGETAPKKQLFSAEQVSFIEKDLNLSNNQMSNLSEDLRVSSGSRKLIESGVKGKLRAINRQLSDLFVSRRCIFATENETLKTRENFEQHVIVCNDVNEVVERVIKTREIDEDNMIVRIGMDGGGGFMKVCLSVFDMRLEKKEQGRLKNRFKDSGVKKLLILAIVPDIQENYINIKYIWL